MPNLSPAETETLKDDRNVNVYHYRGLTVLVGKNALSNEAIITEHEHPNCFWLHAESGKGAHVVLCCNGDPSLFENQDPLRFAAELALQYSKSRSGVVRYARLNDVYKPDGAGLGVFRTFQKTIITFNHGKD